ncbi:MAG TPA: TonB-dependent receptor [Longimicrobiales bacterium]|nr:TonB-dependent receptor [Longimicrobiales bacterium]
MRRLLAVLALISCPLAVMAQEPTGSVVGTVRDAVTGAVIGGAEVWVEGTRLNAMSRDDGRFLLAGVAAGEYVVRASRIGYSTGEETVRVTASGTVEVTLELTLQAIDLEELVATGYGTSSRRELTGAVSSISGDDVLLKAAPNVTISGALQGRAAGVQVLTASGMPGVGTSVRVRGANSITANSEPLYVIDGVPVTQGTDSSDPTQNPLVTVNTNDIESIQVLKDASATAIYGSRGANGVILITTRSGGERGNAITLESNVGVQQLSKTIDVLSARQYRELRNEAMTNVGLTPQYTPDEVSGATTTDYPDLILQDAPQQSHTLSFSGTEGGTQYLISANLLDQGGIIRGTDFRRYSARVNLDRTFSDRFRAGTNLSMTRTKHDVSQVENGQLAGNSRGILAAMVYDPALPVYDEDGEYIRQAVLGEFINNPVATANELVEQRNETRLVGSLFGELSITQDLRLSNRFGVNSWDAYNPYFAPSDIQQGFTTNGAASIWQGRSTELLNETLLNFEKDAFGPGDLAVLGGFTYQSSTFDYTNMEAADFLVEEPMWNSVQGGAQRPTVASGTTDWTLLSYLTRVNYNLLDRYLFTVTGRYDGSSRFGENNKWAFFPSAAVAWRLIDEGFMADQGFFDDLKLRVSFGLTGNQAVGPYNSLAGMEVTESAIGSVNTIAFAPGSRSPNPDLKWETTRQFNVGVDMAFLDNRLSLSADAYTARTEDLLLIVNMPWTSGFADQLRNVGSVKNRGVELSLTSLNVQSGGFSWSSTLNVAANRNEVVAIDERDYIETGGDRWGWAVGGNSHLIKPGEPLGSIYGYRVMGLWQEGDACDLEQPRPTLDCVPGELHVEDVNGDGQITPDDRTIIGYADPDFYGGFDNNFTFGPFTLDAFLTFSVGNDVVNASNAFLMNATGQLNERAEVMDRWTPENTDTDIPRANANRRTLLYSTLVEDGSYLRLQALTLGYQLPQRLLPGIRSGRVYVTGQNLFTITDYSGFDPEVNSLGGSPSARGLDVGAYPRSRIWNLGVSITF